MCYLCALNRPINHFRADGTWDHTPADVIIPQDLPTGLGAIYEIGTARGAAGLGAINEGADFAGNATTTAVLQIGQTAYGSLATGADSDWFRITLTAGQTYEFRLHGMGYGEVNDPYLRLRDSGGNQIAFNDDSSSWSGTNGRDSRIVYTATTSGTFYLDVQSFNNVTSGNYIVTAALQNPAGMVFTADEIAWQLINNYNDQSVGPAAFNVGADNALTINITGLDANGQFLARAALRAWTDVTGIAFVETAGAAEITFDDSDPGVTAYANTTVSNGVITSASVMLTTGWLNQFGTTLNSYSFETYIHEIGHALGLGHGGNYNGNATYGTDNYYLNDSVAWTIMSYMNANNDEFSGPNTFVNASFRYMLTPAIADIIAIQYLYGDRGTAYAGNTTYGYGGNSGNAAIDGFTSLSNASGVTFMTIWDEGGTDTLNFASFSGNQLINLDDESFSNVIGGIANLSIARGVVIENANGGSGSDVILGNGANNNIVGNGGNDTLNGGAGADSLFGGAGDDLIYFDGADVTVNGGANFDYAFRLDGAARGFNMVTNGIERLGWDEVALGGNRVTADYVASPLSSNPALTTYILESVSDARSNQIWNTYTSIYTTGWTLERATQVNDVGQTIRTVETVWDIDGNDYWSTFANNYNAAGQVISQQLQVDSSALGPVTLIENFWDRAGTETWKQFENRYASPGVVVKQSLILDAFDLSQQNVAAIRETFFDWNNTQSWNQRIITYDFDGTVLSDVFV